AVEERVRNGFAGGPDAGDLAHDIGEAVELLDDHRRVDVDAVAEDLVDVVPAMRMAGALEVRLGQGVDDHDVALAGRGSVGGGLPGGGQALDGGGGDDLEMTQQSFRIRIVVGVEEADDDVAPRLEHAARGDEHRESLSHAGEGAEEDLQLAALRGFIPLR